MIEIVTAESGEKVLRFQGRLLASRFDPAREAKDWVRARLSFLDKVRTVVVLGLGSGQHVRELLASTSAKIVVLEASSDVIEAAEKIGAFDRARVSLHHVKDARGVRKIDAIKRAVQGSFIVLAHAPSRALFPEIYDEIRALLVARDWGSLNWQWKLRNSPAFDSTPRIGDETLSLLDLEQTELVANSEERERLLFKALRELIK